MRIVIITWQGINMYSLSGFADVVVVPSKAAVVGVRNDVLLHFCFGPEATGVAAPSFRFGGMGDRWWQWCPNKQTTQVPIWLASPEIETIFYFISILNTVTILSKLPAMKYFQILFYFILVQF